MNALTSLLAVFNPVCDLTEYEFSFTNTSLPVAVEFDNALIELLPRENSERNFLRWYEQGLEECNAFLSTDPFESKKKKHTSPLFNNNARNVASATSCRGNRLFYATTGLLVWPFGPLMECETHSRCWFGLLTCGFFKREEFQSTFDIGPRGGIFRGWSMKALHVDISVSGPEVVAPRVRHTRLPAATNSGDRGTSVLLVDYMLTVNGEYTIHAGLEGLYPGMLSDVTKFNQAEESGRRFLARSSGRKKSSAARREQAVASSHRGSVSSAKNSNTIRINKTVEKINSKLKFKRERELADSRSLQLLRSVYLGGCEQRKGSAFLCVKACQEQARVVGGPFHMRASYIDPAGRVGCTQPHKVPSYQPLPYCTRGNHRGRYLRLPAALLEHCGGNAFSARIVAERARHSGRRQVLELSEAIEHAYFRRAQNFNMDPIYAAMRTGAQSRAGSGGDTGGTGDGGDDDSVTRQDVLYSELLRYLNFENVCLLVDIGVRSADPRSRADIYAPYSCKYRMYDWRRAEACLGEARGDVVFHGDSMNRALFGKFSGTMGVQQLSQSKLKLMTNNEGKNFIQVSSNSSIGSGIIAHFNTWDSSHDFLGGEAAAKPLSGVYLSNFALSHSLTPDLHSRAEYFWHESATVKLWRSAVDAYKAEGWSYDSKWNSTNKNERLPRFTGIYQSASALHGKRNLGFGWMSESVRRNNLLMRMLFIDELGFLDFDEHLLTSAHFEVWGAQDGWHYGGTPGINAAQILANLICNSHSTSS